MSDQNDLTKIRLEVHEHRLRINTVEKILEKQADALFKVGKALDKLEKRFTIFILAIVMSGVFGDSIESLVLKILGI